jgi:tungstate transport system ATP-binding protein
VMQDPLLFDTTVFANVAVGLRFRGSSTTEILSRVPAWLERLGVAALSTRRSSQLSGGEARRVSLARALVLEPALLLLDEPFSALDPPTRMGILDDFGPLLEGLRTTTVLVTHDLYEARRLADRVAIVIGGRLLQVGSFAELEAAPADEAVAAFLAGASIETASTAVEGSP